MKLAAAKEILRTQKIIPRKSRGQNFLADPAVGRRIVEKLELTGGDAVLEIGPGMGALTSILLEKPCHVLAVEIERAFCDVLNEWYALTGRFEVIHSDILDQEMGSLLEYLRSRCAEGGTVKVLSNLPYCISTPVLTALLHTLSLAGERKPFSRMVLTMQKEVADRITAAPGGKQYGSLSVLTQYHCKVKREFQISPGVFYPSPKVTSAVVSFTPWTQPPALVLDQDLFFSLVRASFSARRKTLRNSMQRFFTSHGLDKAKSETLLKRCSIDGTRRAETLSMSEFARMSNMLSQCGVR